MSFVKPLRHIAASLMIPLLFSCQNGENEGLQILIRPQIVFHAEIEQSAESRAYMDEYGKVLWSAGDAISIFAKNNLNGHYSLKGDGGTNKADFILVSEPDGQGKATDLYYAAYPYREGNALVSNDNTVELQLSIPTEQKWTSGSYDPGAQLMVAVSDSKSFLFKNVGSGIGLRLLGDGVNVKSVRLSSNGDEALGGDIIVTAGETPSSRMADGASSEVSLTADSPVTLNTQTPVYFWILTCPAVLKQGFTVTVTDDQGNIFEKTTSREISLQRSRLIVMSELVVTMAEAIPTELGIYPAEGSAHIYDPDSEQVNIYTAEGKSWVRFINPSSLKVIELGPIPVSVTAGSKFTASVSESVSGVQQNSTEYQMEVLSLSDGILTLVSDKSYFVLRL